MDYEIAKASAALAGCSEAGPIGPLYCVFEVCRWHYDEWVLAAEFE